MQNENSVSGSFKFYAHALIFSLLALLLLLQPFSLFFDLESLFGVSLNNSRVVFVGIMLLAATVADSIFAGSTSLRQTLEHIAWVVVAAAVMPTVLQASNAAYLLGILFFIHSFRSSSRLWYGRKNDWLWPAWLRDTSMAIVIFLWL